MLSSEGLAVTLTGHRDVPSQLGAETFTSD